MARDIARRLTTIFPDVFQIGTVSIPSDLRAWNPTFRKPRNLGHPAVDGAEERTDGSGGGDRKSKTPAVSQKTRQGRGTLRN